jgi:chromosomal replication initiator protein
MGEKDLNQLWKSVHQELKLAVTKSTYKTFLAETELVELGEGVAKIGCQSSYLREIVEQRYYGLIKNLLDKQTGEVRSLVFEIQESRIKNQELRLKEQRARSREQKKTTDGSLPLFDSKSREQVERAARRARLRRDFTFKNYAVSPANQLAYAAALAVADNPGKAYNPLFIWGGVGVGKTHLMHAIGYRALEKDPSDKVLCSMGEEFTTEIVDAIRTKTQIAFKKRYRSVKLLLLDDVQFLAGKDTSQDEFFHTFNAIHREGGQIVLTSDRPPGEIVGIEDRLRSRFQAGLAVDIGTPDLELRRAILQIKLKQVGLKIPGEAEEMVAEEIDSPRKIEGFVAELKSRANGEKGEVGMEIIRQLLKKSDEQIGKLRKMVAPQTVIKTVADFYGIKVAQIRGPRRKKEIVFPRQVAMTILNKDLGLNLVLIGEMFGGRDHTTVIHSVEKIEKMMRKSSGLRGEIERIKYQLSG